MATNLTSLAERFRSMNMAKQFVRQKFPQIIEGSSGWYRAIAYRLKKRAS